MRVLLDFGTPKTSIDTFDSIRILADEPIPVREWHDKLQEAYLGESYSFYFR